MTKMSKEKKKNEKKKKLFVLQDVIFSIAYVNDGCVYDRAFDRMAFCGMCRMEYFYMPMHTLNHH